MAATVLLLVVQALALVALSATPAAAADPLGLEPGDLVISDTGHDQVIVVPADGGPDRVVTTEVSDPEGVVVTPGGDVVVADAGNNRVIKVLADGSGVQVLRTGAWSVNQVELDTLGQVLFTGFGFGGIGRVTLGGVFRGYFGTDTAGLSGMGIASDGDVVFAEFGGPVRRMEPDGTSIRAVAGFPPAGNPTWRNYRGLDVDASDRVYVVETNSDALWASNGAANVTLVTTDLAEPSDVALRPDGTAVVADSFNSRVVDVSAAGVVTPVATDAALLVPGGVAIVPIPPAEVGDVFVGKGDGSVLRMSADGSDQVTVATGLDDVRAVAVADNGTAYAGGDGGDIYEIPADGSEPELLLSADGVVTALDVGPDGTLYFADFSGIHRYTAGGGAEDLYLDFSTHYQALAVDSGGQLYAASGSTVSRLVAGDLVALAPRFHDPAGMTWDPAGRLVVVDLSAILTFVDTTTDTSVEGTTFVGDRGVTIAGDGRLLVANSNAPEGVVSLDADGTNQTHLADVASPHAVDTYVPRPSLTAGGPVPGTGNVGTAYAGYTFTAAANGGGTVGFRVHSGSLPPGLSLNAGTGVLSGTPTAAGTYTFRVQAANAARGVVTAVQTVTVGKRLQTIAFTGSNPPAANRRVDGTYVPTATGTGSSAPITFSIDPAASTFCSIASGVVTFLAVGNCVIRADRAGDADYEAAPQVTRTIAVVGIPQTAPVYNETLPSPARVGMTYTPTATATGPGTPVSFLNNSNFLPPSFSTRPCEYDETTGKVTFVRVGACRLQAVRPASDRYAVATSTQRTINITQGILSFGAGTPTQVRVGDTWAATSSAGNLAFYGVEFDSEDAGICTASYPSPELTEVTFTKPGTCVVWASPLSSNDWNTSYETTSITVLKALQTLAFTSTAPTAAVVGDDYTPTATGGASGNPVTFSVAPASAAVCSISGGTVAFEHAGDCVVQAAQLGDDTYEDGLATQTITVGKAAQTITFTTTPTTPSVGEDYTPAATATSLGTVTFSVASASSGVCSISGGTVSFEHVGDCVVQADQVGTADYLTAPTKDQVITVAQGAQTIAFTSTAPTEPVVGDLYTPTATATSGGAVTFSVAPASAGVCEIDSGVVELQHVGDCVVRADQAGDADYLAAVREIQTITVGQAAQTIAFTSTAPTSAVVGDEYTPAADGGDSGNDVVFTIAPASAGVCEIDSGVVELRHVGDCVVRADQDGTTDYLAAVRQIQTITVGQAAQTIAFTSTAPTNAVVAEDYTPSATGGASGNPVVFSVAPASAGVCSISGGTVTFEHTGDCVVRADQEGTTDYLAAVRQIQTIAVDKATQTIVFTSTPTAPAVGGDYEPTATATSGGTVTFSVDPASSGVCSISGGTVSFEHAGDCVVQADQEGTDEYLAAVTTDQTITVGKGSQAIVFDSVPSSAAVGGTFTPAASAGSGDAVTFSVDPASTGVCSLSGGTLSYDHVGDCVVLADQAGNDDYLPATTRQLSVTVERGAQTVSFTSTAPTAAVVGTAYDVTASATSGGAVTLSIAPASAGVCSLAGSRVSFDHVGSCEIRADQAGTTDHLPATTATQTVGVGRAGQTVQFLSTPPVAALPGDTYDVVATATSGEPVTLSVAPASSGVCSVSGSTVRLTHAGDCLVRADQAGTADHQAATASQLVVVGRRLTQTVFTSTPPSPAYVGQTYAVATATTPADGPVSLEVAPQSASRCSVAGSTVTFLHVGVCELRAAWVADGDHVSSVAVQTVTVEPAETALDLDLRPLSVKAVVTVVEPGGGTPEGEVEFRLDGDVIGTAELEVDDDGVVSAVLGERVRAAGTYEIVASYLGSDDHVASAASVELTAPQVGYTVTSERAKSRFGWYRTPVTVRFTCVAGSAPVVACPDPVRLTRNRDGRRPIIREVVAEDSGWTVVTVRGLRIDRVRPKVSVRGVENGATYDNVRELRCQARDRLSGIARCKVTTTRRGNEVAYRAVAVDRAGNRTVVRGRYFLK